jgi:hypothetical protein
MFAPQLRRNANIDSAVIQKLLWVNRLCCGGRRSAGSFCDPGNCTEFKFCNDYDDEIVEGAVSRRGFAADLDPLGTMLP